MNRALSVRVRARCDLLGSSRAHTSRRKSPHANSCRPSERNTLARRQQGYARAKAAALEEAPAPLTHVRSAIVAANAARAGSLDARADRDAHAHEARRHEKAAALHNGKNAVGQKSAEQSAPSETRQTRRSVMQMPHGGDWQLDAHAKLCHVDVRRYTTTAKKAQSMLWTLHSIMSCMSSCDELSARRQRGPTYSAAPPRRGRP